MALSQKLSALTLALCLLAGPVLAGGASRRACCARSAARSCCSPTCRMGKGACALHAHGSCALRSGGDSLAILHLHPELSLRPAVAARPVTAPGAGGAAALAEPAFSLPVSFGTGPEPPPPRSFSSLAIV